MAVHALATPLLVLALCAPPAHPILAEIVYDAVGDDSGHEFVELFNPTSVPFALGGARLESGDGAGPGRWTPRWTGGSGDTIPAGGRFVVGGAQVVPAPDAVATLDLQNGPDAVRLVWPDGATEVVGYGELAFAEYFCGAPAPDVASGLALARVPDPSDLGSNALDFRAAAPSPGAPNLPARDAALISGTLALAPEQPAAGTPATLSGAVHNPGAEPIAEAELELRVTGSRADGVDSLTSVLLPRRIEPGDTARFELALPGQTAGKRLLRVRATLAGDGAPGNDADSVACRIGPGPLEVTEIQFHPTHGEGEWVEVRNRAGEPISMTDFGLADRRGVPGAPSGGDGALAADSFAVLAQDRAALLAHFPSLDGTRVWEVKPWASLNNSNDSTGVADVVSVRDTDGTPCDRVAYSAAGVPAGVPIERRGEGDWSAATDPLGGPLAPPRALPPLARRFAVSPRRLAAAGARTASIGWDLPWPRGRIAVDLYDLAGRRLAQVIPETSVPGRGERRWDAQSLPPGFYLLALVARADGAADIVTLTQAVRVDGSAP